MKAFITHALTAVGAFALAMLVGYAVQPAEAATTAAPTCASQGGSAASTSTPLAREHLLAV